MAALSYRIVAMQAISAAVVAVALMPFGPEQAWSALLAGAVSVMPNALFAWQSERERSPGRLVAFGALRFFLTVVLLGVVLALLKPAPLGFFVTFALAQLAYVAGPLLSRGAT